MNSCKVFVINDSLSREDVTFATKPKVQLRAVPYGASKKQIVKDAGSAEQDIFAVYEVATSIPADITGMALFLTISNSDGVVYQVKGKVNTDVKGLVSFKPSDVPAGFYSYEVCVKAAKEYSQNLLHGSYVVQP